MHRELETPAMPHPEREETEDSHEAADGHKAAEKHGSLFGGALDEGVLASSRKVLSRNRGGDFFTGLQQWFSPLPAAQLISEVFGAPDIVLDPAAGAGSLLCPYPDDRRFGIEIDRDHTKDPAYNGRLPLDDHSQRPGPRRTRGGDARACTEPVTAGARSRRPIRPPA